VHGSPTEVASCHHLQGQCCAMLGDVPQAEDSGRKIPGFCCRLALLLELQVGTLSRPGIVQLAHVGMYGKFCLLLARQALQMSVAQPPRSLRK